MTDSNSELTKFPNKYLCKYCMAFKQWKENITKQFREIANDPEKWIDENMEPMGTWYMEDLVQKLVNGWLEALEG